MDGSTKAHITTDWSFRGLQTLVLTIDELRLVVLPELGGKIWQLTCARSGRDVLWHNSRVSPRQVPFGSIYDDVFFGGWDELFPNDAAEQLAGEAYPDHGELWTLPWDWTVEQRAGDEVSVHLSCRTPISGCSVEKTISLRMGRRTVRVRSVLRNENRNDLPYLWKQHVAVPVDGKATLDLPARTVVMEDFGNPRARALQGHYEWPYLVDGDGVSHDMRNTLPGSSGVSEFQYGTALDDGWCALTNDDGTGIGLAFDRQVFSTCWTFASYGGWRGLEVLILEPCTGYPVQMSDGIAAGTHRTLQAGECVETSVTAVLYSGRSAVTAVRPDGTVEGPGGTA